MSQALSKTGQRQLAEAEAVIAAGIQTWEKVGLALLAIRDRKLYRADYATFDDYCRGRWDFTARRANQLMTAAEIGTMVPIENERQGRALALLLGDEDGLRRAFDIATKAGSLSAESLRAAVDEVLGVVDTTATEITVPDGTVNEDEPPADENGEPLPMGNTQDVAGAPTREDGEADDETPAPHVAGAGSPAGLSTPATPPPPAETPEERDARVAEEQRVERNRALGEHLIGLNAVIGDANGKADQLLEGWDPDTCPAYLVDATRFLFTGDGMRDLAARLEKFAAKWEAAGV